MPPKSCRRPWNQCLRRFQGSLRAKILVPVILLIVGTSTVSTGLFTVAHRKSIERELIARGAALSYALSQAAAVGLAQEDLDLIRKAAFIIHAEDVSFVQVYSNLWDAIDAFPFERLKEAPHPDAVRHFASRSSPLHIRRAGVFDFYHPISVMPFPGSAPITIGFTRISLSSGSMQEEIRWAVFMNFLAAFFITVFSLTAIGFFLDRLVMRRIGDLRDSIAMFKQGLLADTPTRQASDEIGEVAAEFYHMSCEIKEKGDRLALSEKRLSSLFDRVEHAIFRTDGNGRIVETNRVFVQLFGTAEELCDILPDAERCPIKEFPVGIRNIELHAVGRNGEELAVLLSLYPESDATGAVTGYDGFIIDVSERKRLEEVLRQAQKMEAIGALAGGVAHDFNNILQGILGYASLLKMEISASDPHRTAIEVIERSALRAADLTKQLLGFARGGKYESKAVNLNKAVENVLQIVARTIDRSIEIRRDMEEPLYPVLVDQSQIENVVLNIVLNARDAMPHGGVLSVRTSNFEGKPADTPLEAGRYVCLQISDTGTGMGKDIQKRIFEPFFTTKERGRGTGMGLAMAYGVLMNHGGAIGVASEPGAGSTLSFYLPATDIEAREEFAPSRTLFPGAGTVLVVDDEDIVRDFVRSALSRYGYTVLEARDGLEAVEVYRQRQNEIDLVLLDMIMPNMSGKETFEKMKEINPAVKVLVSSGYSFSAAVRETIAAGAVDFLQKPFDLDRLREMVSAQCAAQR